VRTWFRCNGAGLKLDYRIVQYVILSKAKNLASLNKTAPFKDDF
jgi:hypothetical protein